MRVVEDHTQRVSIAFGHIPSWIGAPVRDRDGRDVGVVAEILFDDTTHRPAWLCLTTERAAAFVPADGISSCARHLAVPHDAETIAASVTVTGGVWPTLREDQIRLSGHFGRRPAPGTWNGAISAPRALPDYAAASSCEPAMRVQLRPERLAS